MNPRKSTVALACMGLGVFLLPALSQIPDKESPKGDAVKEKDKRAEPDHKENPAGKDTKKPEPPKKASDEPVLNTRAVMQLLKQPIETKPLQEKVTLKTALEFINERVGGKLPFLVDKHAFTTELGADAPDPYEQEVSLPPVPVKMATGSALNVILRQIGNGKGTYLVRDGAIWITTRSFAASDRLLKMMVFASIEKTPLSEVLQDLSGQTGLPINIDDRIGAKAKAPITAAFPNSTLEDALVTVTESADLKFVVYPYSIYVTSPNQVHVLENEEKNRKSVHDHEKALKALGGLIIRDDTALGHPIIQVFLDGANLTDTGLNELAGLKSLRHLGLAGTMVTDAGMIHLVGLESLQSLNLKNTHVTGAKMKELEGLQSLQSLYLGGTQLTDTGLKELAALKRLQILDLGGTKVTDAGIKHLAGLGVHYLGLDKTQVTDVGLKELAGLKSLHNLNLDSTQVTDMGLKELATLKNLQFLRLQGTKVTDAGVVELGKALPNCKIGR